MDNPIIDPSAEPSPVSLAESDLDGPPADSGSDAPALPTSPRHWAWLLCYAVTAFSLTLAAGWSVDVLKGKCRGTVIAPEP